MDSYDYKHNTLIPLICALLLTCAVCFNHYLASFFHLMHGSLLSHLSYFPVFLVVGMLLLFGFFITKLPSIIKKIDIIILFLLIFSTQTDALYHIGFLDMGDIVAGLGLIILIMRSMCYEKEKLTYSFICLVALALLFFMFFSCIHGGVGSILSCVSNSKGIITLILMINLINNKERMYLAIKFLFVSTTISCLIGLVQEILYYSTEIMLVGMVPKGSKRFMVSHDSPFLRIPALFSTPQMFANTLATNIPICLFILLNSKSKLFAKRSFLRASLILMIINIIFTFSRGAWGSAFLSVFLISYILKPKYFFHITIFFSTLLLFFYFSGIGGLLKETLYHKMGSADIAIRAKLIRQATTGFIDRYTWIGVGLNKGKFYTPNGRKYTVHNAFAAALIEIGVGGFILYCMMFIILTIRIFHATTVAKESHDKVLMKSYLLGLLALILDLQFEPFFHFIYTWVLFGLIEGSVIVLLKESNESAEEFGKIASET